ncbi:MAG: methionine--tRNA ligase [Prevotella sp.]|nr:methionine--tRNA ligase [Staphylococcus sp.]MCM1350477.1 methionine--tRNA ligase [Prevotella sp.]
MCKKCYVSTPIYYASGNIQIGNSYTTVACDVYARYNRQMGRKTFFLTGMDEHGQKIEEAATKAGVAPQAFVDEVARQTQALWQAMHVDYDYFVRTTDKNHEHVVAKVFEQLLNNDDIYLGTYSGHYCVSCETFFTEKELGENHTCPDCGKPTKIVSEESYFLRLKKYAQPLLEYIESHPDFIQPITRRNEVVSFIQSGLEDLCVSRTSFEWGVKVPSNPKHVIYVWIDALFNYLTSLGYGSDQSENYQTFWVNNDRVLHVIGKDILRFHAIYWPILLMALNIPIQFKLYVHGWILTKEGKMSKSRGNAVYPMELMNRYGVDSVRYYLAKELPLGNDGLFSYERFIERYNTELANDLGNLVSRTVSMIEKYCNGIVPEQKEATPYDISLQETVVLAIAETKKNFEAFELQNAMQATWQLVRRVNKYIDETAPWLLAKDENKIGELSTVMYHLAESLRIIAHLVAPYLVETAPKILQSIGQPKDGFDLVNLSFGKPSYGAKVVKTESLFQRLDVKLEMEYFEKKKNANAEVKKQIEAPLISIDDFSKVVLKIGEIIDCQKHQNAEKLLVSQIQIGSETRQIVSGIAKYYSPTEMIGKKVVVVTNLKPVKIRGVESCGMVLCAANEETLELLEVKKMPNGTMVR